MKRASQPNASEREHMQKVSELGCVACYVLSGLWGTPSAIHHISGSRRTDVNPEPHKQVLGLCGAHHQGTEKKPGGYVHGQLVKFESEIGTQEYLLQLTLEFI